jgi:hypothetical protein
MSNSSKCEGFTSEGLLGYTSTKEPGTTIIRCTKDGHHFVSADKQECIDRGYTYEGKLGNQP